MINTLEWQHSHLIILDQTKLPTEITYIKCSDYQRVALAIKRLEVRGAPAIGAAAAFAMVLGFNELFNNCLSNKESFWAKYELIKNELIAARPTAARPRHARPLQSALGRLPGRAARYRDRQPADALR